MRLSSHVCQTSSHQDAWLGMEGPLPKWLSHMVASWCWLLAGGLRSSMFESFHKSEWVSPRARDLKERVPCRSSSFYEPALRVRQHHLLPVLVLTYDSSVQHGKRQLRAWKSGGEARGNHFGGRLPHPFLSAFTSLSATQSFFLRLPLLLQWPFAQCPFWGL